MAEDDERGPRRWELATLSLRPGAPPPAAAAPTAGRFDERGELGRGGMGRVVEAVDRTLGRTVAIKHSLASDAVSLARFQREVLITARLQHPGIMPILDVGHDDDGRPYYVMRRIHGEPLERRVAAATTLADRVALVPAVLAAVDAAAYAHAQGIVHRDIKPANLLLGPFGEVLLIDWGLARQVGDDAPAFEPARAATPGLTRAGQAIGTPGFMAPEQARGEPTDRRADVYALGATLHFTLAGRPPFDGVPPTRMIELAAHNATPAALPDDVPVGLAAIARKALAADPAARYPDAGALADDLRRFLAGQLVAAHPYTTRDRIAHGLRRHRLVAGVAAAALVALAIVGGLALAQIIAERDHADAARRLAEDRADELVVDRARALVHADPTSALAALHDLPATSSRWPIAREIVRAAVAGGYDHLIDRGPRMIHAVAFSPAGRLAMASALTGGGVRVYDGDRARDVSDRGAPVLAWLDDRVLAAITLARDRPSTLALIDTVSGARTERALAFDHEVVARGRLYLLAGDRVLEVTAAGTSREIAAGIAAIDARADRVALLGHDRLIVLDRDGTARERRVALPGRILQVRIAPSGDRVAAFIYPGVVAWTLSTGAEAAWPSWPGSYESLNGILFAGETPYGWSTVTNTLVSFEPAGVVPHRRLVPIDDRGVQVASDGDGAILASRAGELVYADALGAVPVAHRALAISALALDAARHRVALGTSDGELVMLELGAALPVAIAVDPHDQLQAAGRGVALVSRDDSLAIVDARARRELGAPGSLAFAWITEGRVVASGGTPGHRGLAVYQLDGAPVLRANDVESMMVGDGLAGGTSVFYTTAAGAVIEAGLEPPAPPRTLAWFLPVTRHGRTMTAMFGLQAVDRALAITSVYDDAWSTWIFDQRGLARLPIGPHLASFLQRTHDGTWWFIADSELWRVPPGGAAARAPFTGRVRRLAAIGDRLWALGEAQVFELTATGELVRALGAVGLAQVLPDGFVRGAPDAVAVVSAAAGVQRTLAVAGAPLTVRASPDGRTVAALLAIGGAQRVAIWTDPVPGLAAALPGYLAALTRARLTPGSDAVTWAP